MAQGGPHGGGCSGGGCRHAHIGEVSECDKTTRDEKLTTRLQLLLEQHDRFENQIGTLTEQIAAIDSTNRCRRQPNTPYMEDDKFFVEEVQFQRREVRLDALGQLRAALSVVSKLISIYQIHLMYKRKMNLLMKSSNMKRNLKILLYVSYI